MSEDIKYLISAIRVRLSAEMEELGEAQRNELCKDVEYFISAIEKHSDDDDLLDEFVSAILFQFYKHSWKQAILSSNK